MSYILNVLQERELAYQSISICLWQVLITFTAQVSMYMSIKTNPTGPRLTAASPVFHDLQLT